VLINNKEKERRGLREEEEEQTTCGLKKETLEEWMDHGVMVKSEKIMEIRFLYSAPGGRIGITRDPLFQTSCEGSMACVLRIHTEASRASHRSGVDAAQPGTAKGYDDA
jgi:hypothetical protein